MTKPTETCACPSGGLHRITCPTIALSQPNAMTNADGDVFYPDSDEDAAWFATEHGARFIGGNTDG